MKISDKKNIVVKNFYIYMLRCSDNSLYCGQTNNIKRRLTEHQSTTRGSKYVHSRLPMKLVYTEKVDTITEALKRERTIKSMSKSEKEHLIKVHGEKLASGDIDFVIKERSDINLSQK